MILRLAAILVCLCPVMGTAAPVSIPGFSFQDGAALNAGLPKSTGGLTRETFLGIAGSAAPNSGITISSLIQQIHGSAQPNSGITISNFIQQVHGSAQPNSGITAKELGTFGAANGLTVYVGLAPVAIPVLGAPRGTPAQDWLFGMLYTSLGPTFALAKSGASGLSETTGFGPDDTNTDLLAALDPLGFGSDDIRNVLFAQNAPISAVPLPAPAVLVLSALLGFAALKRCRLVL